MWFLNWSFFLSAFMNFFWNSAGLWIVLIKISAVFFSLASWIPSTRILRSCPSTPLTTHHSWTYCHFILSAGENKFCSSQLIQKWKICICTVCYINFNVNGTTIWSHAAAFCSMNSIVFWLIHKFFVMYEILYHGDGRLNLFLNAGAFLTKIHDIEKQKVISVFGHRTLLICPFVSEIYSVNTLKSCFLKIPV
jgi:hypothetical protein